MARHMKEGDSSARQPGGRPNAYTQQRTTYVQPPVDYQSRGSMQRKRRRRPSVAGIILLALLVALGVYGFLFFSSVMTVRAEAREVTDLVRDLKAEAKDTDFDAAAETADQMAQLAADMHEQTQGLLWDIASFIPIVGEDIGRVRVIAEVADELCSDGLVPLVGAVAETPLSELFSDGAINVDGLMQVIEAVEGAHPIIEESAQRLNDLGNPVLPQVAEPLNKVRSQLNDAANLLNSLNGILDRLPELLGADGTTRHYLIVAQTNSEARATGGFAGSWGLLEVKDGQLELRNFRSMQKRTWPTEEERPEMTDEEINLFGEAMVTTPTNVSMTPHFPRAAELMRWYWAFANKGQQVDAVIVLDPVFLQECLALTEGFDASNGWHVDGTNAARLLLNQVYWDLPTKEQDEFFAEVAGNAFKLFLGSLGDVSLSDLVDLVQRAAESHRVLVWFPDEEMEEFVTALGFDGALGTDPTQPELGVYVNDDSWAKICWYMDLYTTIDSAERNSDGTTTYHCTTVIRNMFDPTLVDVVPHYISGYSPEQRNPCDMVTRILFVAPAGGMIYNVECSAEVSDGHDYHLNGLPCWTGMVKTNMGEITVFHYDIVTAAGAEDLTVRQTPLGQTIEH